ncbi:shikimate kinase [Luteolibacter sp. AS25]|uniref:shikimate kinase n=1 Tax=Luteolibacter sp. AS25 TaxID=3135776 RepID=UPI00398B17FA
MNKLEVIPKNIVLIGFMGSGKSTVGRELHERLGYQLTDMDQLIEESMGKKITEIFKEEGEQAFRDFETLQLIEIAKQTDKRHIISTGGGIVVRAENRQLLKKLGYVVWLHAPEEVILERTSRNRDRPLLNTPNAAEKISQLLAVRTPWYQEAAHLKVDTAGLDSGEIATGILESARYHFSHPV